MTRRTSKFWSVASCYYGIQCAVQLDGIMNRESHYSTAQSFKWRWRKIKVLEEYLQCHFPGDDSWLSARLFSRLSNKKRIPWGRQVFSSLSTMSKQCLVSRECEVQVHGRIILMLVRSPSAFLSLCPMYQRIPWAGRNPPGSSKANPASTDQLQESHHA